MRKRCYLVAVAVVLGLNLAGCSGGAQGTSANAPQASAETQETGDQGGLAESSKEEGNQVGNEVSREEKAPADGENKGAASDREEIKAQETETASQEQKAEETQATETAETAAPVKHSGFLFVSQGVIIGMNEDVAPILAGLGAYSNYAESPSCAFKGIDKIYSYSGFDLYTYPTNGVDYVNSIYFTDESVSTPEGIHIGSSIDEMIAAYGTGYTEEYGVYTYTNEKSTLSFIVTDGVVETVEYLAIIN